MSSHKTLRATLLISLLVSTTLLPAFSLIPTATAQTTHSTTFYFTKYAFDFDLFGSSTPVSQTYPTSPNVSALPPITNTDDFANWVLLWGLVKTSDELFNDSYYGDFDFLFDFLNPLLIRESYTYQGEDIITVQGDAYFTLFFNSYIKRRFPRFQDTIEVTISHKGTRIANKTMNIEPERLDGIIKKEYKKNIKINDLDFQLQTGDSLSFTLELLLTNKTLPNILKSIPETGPLRNILTPISNIIRQFINNSERFDPLKEILQLKDQALEILSEFNVTAADVADLINDALPIHAYLVYDSPDYPSSVTIPAGIEDTDAATYYLQPNNQLTLTYPTAAENPAISLRNSAAQWQSTPLPRNKIIVLNNATMSLYLSKLTLPLISFLQKKSIKVTLKADNETLATATNTIDDPSLGKLLLSIKEFFKGPRTPTLFTFTGENTEIPYDTSISVRVEMDGTGGFISRPKLFYGSTAAPSALHLTLRETNNINMSVSTTPTDEQIVPGDSIIYNLSISSKYADSVTINTTKIEETGSWDIKITPSTLNIAAGSTNAVTLTITSTNPTKDAYQDFLSLRITAEGKTGRATHTIFAEVSENAIDYKVSIPSFTETKKIKKGTNGTFNFIIKNENTGAIDDTDTYTITVTSDNNWELQYIDKYRNLKRGSSTDPKDIPVILSVPRNTTLSEDTLTFTVSSDGSDGTATASVTVTVEVLSLSFFETIYDAFESAAETIGLDNTLGEYAPLGLATILLLIIMIIIIILALLITKKLFSVYCVEPIQEIDPNEHADFTINIRNHAKKPQTFTVTTAQSNPVIKWDTKINPETITIPAASSDTIHIHVTPTKQVNPNDWVEIPITIQIQKKRKTIRLSTMVSVREGKPILQITDVFTWPKEITKGDRVITSFKLENKGSLSARSVKVVLYLNGRQKNKVKATIPSGGYADIKIPWTAVKGKNKLLIKAVEK